MAIKPLFQVEIKIPSLVWNKFEHDVDFQTRLMEAANGSEESGIDSVDGICWYAVFGNENYALRSEQLVNELIAECSNTLGIGTVTIRRDYLTHNQAWELWKIMSSYSEAKYIKERGHWVKFRFGNGLKIESRMHNSFEEAMTEVFPIYNEKCTVQDGKPPLLLNMIPFKF